MQAGEQLDFVKPFDILSEGDTPEHDKRADDLFIAFCKLLLERYPDNIEAAQKFVGGEFVVAFESMLRLTAPDGSYLHVVVYGHDTKEGTSDLSICVSEHADTGVYLGGYKYTFNHEGLSRITIPAEVDEEDDCPDATHFSLLASYQELERLEALEASDDEVMRVLAEDTRGEYDERATFELWSVELGYDGRAPDYDEVSALVVLLDAAKPLQIEDLSE